MWLKFIKTCDTNKEGDIVWSADNLSAQEQVNSGNAIRCLGPDGAIFEDSPAERVIAQLAAEDHISYEEEEHFLLKNRKNWSSYKRLHADLGNYIDDTEI